MIDLPLLPQLKVMILLNFHSCMIFLSGSAMSYWLSEAPAVGASGAIFGLVTFSHPTFEFNISQMQCAWNVF